MVSVHGAFEPLRAEWDALVDRAGGTPWQRPGWFEPFARAFGGGRLELVALRRGDELAGVAAMERRRLGELRALANWHTPSFALAAADDDARAELARAVYARGAPVTAFHFLPPEDPSLDVLRRVAPARTIVRTLERSPYVPIEGTWEEYCASLDQHLTKELRRRRRRLEEQGPVEVEVHDGTERLHELLEEGLRVEAAGWKGAQGTAIASQPATRRFYTEIAEWGAERGWLRLVFLRVGGRPLAFHFAWEADGVHYLLKTGIDPEYAKFAPGKLLVQSMIERSFTRAFRMYDFLGDVAPWKEEWRPRIRELRLVQAFAPTVPGVGSWAAWRFGRPLAKRLRTFVRR